MVFVSKLHDFCWRQNRHLHVVWYRELNIKLMSSQRFSSAKCKDAAEKQSPIEVNYEEIPKSYQDCFEIDSTTGIVVFELVQAPRSDDDVWAFFSNKNSFW